MSSAFLNHKKAKDPKVRVSGGKQILMNRVWFLQTGEEAEEAAADASAAPPKQRQTRKSKVAPDAAARSARRKGKRLTKRKVANDGDEEERPEDAGFAFCNMNTLTATQKKENAEKSLLDVDDPELRTASGSGTGRSKGDKGLGGLTRAERDTANFYKELKARNFGHDIKPQKAEQKAAGTEPESEATERGTDESELEAAESDVY